MTIEQLKERVLSQFDLNETPNLKTHLHTIDDDVTGNRYLSYFNQPIVVEVEGYCYPFPCEELFCPSFNGKTSRLVDFYILSHEECKKQWETLPDNFPLYKPRSVRCERPKTR